VYQWDEGGEGELREAAGMTCSGLRDGLHFDGIAPAEMPIVTVSDQWTYVLVHDRATAKLMWVRALQ
jgi:hypothetical protein